MHAAKPVRIEMPYILIGKNGEEYGPVELDTLITWARDGRVLPQADVRITPGGTLVKAHTIPMLGLENLPPKAIEPPIAAAYPRPDVQPFEEKPSKYGLVSITFWSVLAVTLIIFTRNYGYIMAFLGVIDMFQAWKRKDPYLFQILTIGMIAIIVAVVALILK